MNDALIQELVERLQSRFYGKYRGTVTDVDAATMRIKAQVPAVLGAQDSGWCMACVPYAGPQVGFVMLPEVGSGVWIEFEGGDVSYPIWSGCYWRTDEVPPDADADAKAVFAKAGKLVFDNNAPSITLEDSSSHSVVLGSSGVTVKGDAAKVVVGSTVSVNDGALEVQ